MEDLRPSDRRLLLDGENLDVVLVADHEQVRCAFHAVAIAIAAQVRIVGFKGLRRSRGIPLLPSVDPVERQQDAVACDRATVSARMRWYGITRVRVLTSRMSIQYVFSSRIYPIASYRQPFSNAHTWLLECRQLTLMQLCFCRSWILLKDSSLNVSPSHGRTITSPAHDHSIIRKPFANPSAR